MSDSDRASNRGTNARKRDRPRKGKDQAEREELSLTHSLMEGKQQVHRQPQGARRTDRKRRKPYPKEKSPSLKNNLPTGGRTGQVNLEADLRSGEHNGENQESPKTRSHREVHPEIGHQRQQGAKLSHRPQPAEKRVGDERQPQTPSKGRGGNTEPPQGTVKNPGKS